MKVYIISIYTTLSCLMWQMGTIKELVGGVMAPSVMSDLRQGGLRAYPPGSFRVWQRRWAILRT